MAIKTSNGKTTKRGASRNTQSHGPSRHELCMNAVCDANGWLVSRALKGSHPWAGLSGMPQKITDGSYYTGTNVVILMAAQDVMGFRSPLWGSFKALKDSGMSLMKDSHHTRAVFGGFIERKVDASAAAKTALDSEEGGTSAAPATGSADGGSGRRAVIPTLQPVQLFNLGQCAGYTPDPRPQPDHRVLTAIRAKWLECGAHAAAQYARWDDEHPDVSFNAEEAQLVVRLATDFAVMRATGEPSAIEEPLPNVPELGARFLKVCGVAYELSVTVELDGFGKTLAERKGRNSAPDDATKEAGDAVVKSEHASDAISLPGNDDLTAAIAGDHSVPSILTELEAAPDWMGVW